MSATLDSTDRAYLFRAAQDWYDDSAFDWDEDERDDFAAYCVGEGYLDMHLPSVWRVFRESR